MGDINFLPGDEHHKRPHHATPPPRVEYTQADGQLSPAAVKPKRSFLSWRRTRQQRTSPVPPLAPAASAVPMHPGQTPEPDASLNLLEGTPARRVPERTVAAGPATLRAPSAPAPNLLTTTDDPGAQRAAHAVHEPEVAPPAPVEHAKTRRQRAASTQAVASVTNQAALDVNFIPSKILEQTASANRLRDLIFVGLGALALVLALYGGVHVYQGKLLADTGKTVAQIQQLDQQLAQFAPLQQDAAALSTQLSAAYSVLQRHVYWIPFLHAVESLTLPTVYYQSMTGAAQTGTFVFDVVAPNYQQIDQQVQVLQQSAVVQAVAVTSATSYAPAAAGSSPTATAAAPIPAPDTVAVNSAVRFSMSVTFDPALFHYTSTPL